MSSLQEALFDRLYARYRNTFGAPLPFRVASVEDAIAYMRSRLRAHANETAKSIGARSPSDVKPRQRYAPSGGHTPHDGAWRSVKRGTEEQWEPSSI